MTSELAPPIISKIKMADKVQEWTEKWEKGTTSWHREKVDDRLKKHLNQLTNGRPNISILVTWCGKSLDLAWLCSEGHNVVGIELSEIAAKQFFSENSIPFSITKEREFIVYQATDRKLKFIVGDFYNVTPEVTETFEAIWDHNAFGAVYPTDRKQYISLLITLLKPGGRILLSNWEYGENKRDKAPFSLSAELIKSLFEESFTTELLDKSEEYSEYFIKKFNVDWGYELLHLLSHKSAQT